MTSEQTERFYRKLLEERGVKNVTEVFHLSSVLSLSLLCTCALQQTMSFCLSVGHGFKVLKKIRVCPDELFLYIEACLYRLWNTQLPKTKHECLKKKGLTLNFLLFRWFPSKCWRPSISHLKPREDCWAILTCFFQMRAFAAGYLPILASISMKGRSKEMAFIKKKKEFVLFSWLGYICCAWFFFFISELLCQ